MSSNDLALRVRDLGKRYVIAQRGARPGTLAEAALRALRPGPREAFWANRHVSFEVNRGEVVGLIGHNGAGKSTLLKLLSRIVEPTEGTIDLYGRVGSLLEVGSGFHPELTGRENIYLNGAILGLTRREIDAAFDEIVAFFGYPHFLETPVKRYSSGMYVRLAFAVAANLRSDILIVDEVLAVGDAEFQKRCLGKMHDVARSGRTVFFVSHNLAAITALCTRAILLKGGQVYEDGPVESVAQTYQRLARAGVDTSGDLSRAQHTGSGEARCIAVRVAAETEMLYAGGDITVEVDVAACAPVDGLEVRVTLADPNTYRLIEASSAAGRLWLTMAEGERRTVAFHLRDVLLRPGLYTLGLRLGRPEMEPTDAIEHAAVVDIALDPANAASALLPAGPYDLRYTVDSKP